MIVHCSAWKLGYHGRNYKNLGLWRWMQNASIRSKAYPLEYRACFSTYCNSQQSLEWAEEYHIWTIHEIKFSDLTNHTLVHHGPYLVEIRLFQCIVWNPDVYLGISRWWWQYYIVRDISLGHVMKYYTYRLGLFFHNNSIHEASDLNQQDNTHCHQVHPSIFTLPFSLPKRHEVVISIC